MKKNLLIFSFVIFILGLSSSPIVLAADDTGCTNATTATPAGYGGVCTDVGTDLNLWLSANTTKECVAGKCLSVEHSAPNWKCCRTKLICSNCVAIADCADADKLTATCADSTKVCCKPKCDPSNCKASCTGTFVLDASKSASSCTDPDKKACCKIAGSGSTTTASDKTEGSTIPLAPLSPVGEIDIQTFIGIIIKGILGIVGSIALLMFVYGGFLMLVSQGDTAKVKKGKDTLIWATAGLAVIFGSYVFVSFILDALSKAGG